MRNQGKAFNHEKDVLKICPRITLIDTNDMQVFTTNEDAKPCQTNIGDGEMNQSMLIWHVGNCRLNFSIHSGAMIDPEKARNCKP